MNNTDKLFPSIHTIFKNKNTWMRVCDFQNHEINTNLSNQFTNVAIRLLNPEHVDGFIRHEKVVELSTCKDIWYSSPLIALYSFSEFNDFIEGKGFYSYSERQLNKEDRLKYYVHSISFVGTVTVKHPILYELQLLLPPSLQIYGSKIDDKYILSGILPKYLFKEEKLFCTSEDFL